MSEHLNVLVTGPTGTGKSYIASAIGRAACRRRQRALYRRVPRLFDELALARADGSYAKLLSRLAKTDVLILDDSELGTLTEAQRHDLLEVMEDRDGSRSTVVTSQLPIAKWYDWLGDPTLADAVLDRLVHNAYKLELRGNSRRKEKPTQTTESRLGSREFRKLERPLILSRDPQTVARHTRAAALAIRALYVQKDDATNRRGAELVDGPLDGAPARRSCTRHDDHPIGALARDVGVGAVKHRGGIDDDVVVDFPEILKGDAEQHTIEPAVVHRASERGRDVHARGRKPENVASGCPHSITPAVRTLEQRGHSEGTRDAGASGVSLEQEDLGERLVRDAECKVDRASRLALPIHRTRHGDDARIRTRK